MTHFAKRLVRQQAMDDLRRSQAFGNSRTHPEDGEEEPEWVMVADSSGPSEQSQASSSQEQEMEGGLS
jgi:hypothetical protein